jgi:dienelactone hydrolase
LTDHPVFIPTSEGPVGGIVSEPDGECCAAIVLLAGYGRPARSGVNSFWTRMARSLAELGVVALRTDYCREGETLPIGEGGSGQIWKRDLDLHLLEQVAVWFRGRVGNIPLLLAGSCSGARLAIELAGREPDAVAGTFLIVPYLRALAQPGREGSAESGALNAVDSLVVDCLQASLGRSPGWILTGERDSPDVSMLTRLIGSTPHELDVELVPGVALHLLDQPYLQDEVSARLMARVSDVLAATARQ